MPKKKTDFKALQRKWYKKLAASGFEDIEDSPHTLKRYDSSFFQQTYDPDSYVAKERYFSLATQLLHTYKFTSARQRRVWELHCEGWSVEDIKKKCRMGTDQVQRVITEVAAWIKTN